MKTKSLLIFFILTLDMIILCKDFAFILCKDPPQKLIF